MTNKPVRVLARSWPVPARSRRGRAWKWAAACRANARPAQFLASRTTPHERAVRVADARRTGGDEYATFAKAESVGAVRLPYQVEQPVHGVGLVGPQP
jgi:hypothetical protein